MVLEQVSPPRVHFRFHRARSSKRNPPNFKIPEIPRPIDGNMPEKLFFLEVCTAGGLERLGLFLSQPDVCSQPFLSHPVSQ
jgi:hypothetical protein